MKCPVVITRALHDAADFAQPLLAAGDCVVGVHIISCTGVDFVPPAPTEAPDWLVFTSRWGVIHYLKRMKPLDSATSIAVVGPQTKELLEEKGVTVTLLAPEGDSQSLAKALMAGSSGPCRIVWPCGNRALTHWTTPLQQAGWTIDPLVVYHTLQRQHLDDSEQNAILSASHIAFTSPSCVIALAQWLEKSNNTLSPFTQLVGIGPSTQQALLQAFGQCHTIAQPHTLAGLATACSASLAAT